MQQPRTLSGKQKAQTRPLTSRREEMTAKHICPSKQTNALNATACPQDPRHPRAQSARAGTSTRVWRSCAKTASGSASRPLIVSAHSVWRTTGSIDPPRRSAPGPTTELPSAVSPSAVSPSTPATLPPVMPPAAACPRAVCSPSVKTEVACMLKSEGDWPKGESTRRDVTS
eukprot:6202162-Pleurochrysis_carterae.AAC.7